MAWPQALPLRFIGQFAVGFSFWCVWALPLPAPRRMWQRHRSARLALEAGRPQFHFTPEKNWMNDPNGLVYWQGEYHLFFQSNPFGVTHGNMTWGHAVSGDLINWKQLDNALLPDEHGDIWSGSVVVDLRNSSGLQLPGKDPPLVAFYTSHPPTPKGKYVPYKHDQRLAFSHDKGRTWTKLPDPVIPLFKDERDGGARDPKVDWHEPTQQWIMVLWLHRDNVRETGNGKAQSTFGLFTSKNLRSWKHVHNIEMLGDYECPDMFELPVTGLQGPDRKYVFFSAGGTYLIGDFDGERFVPSGPQQHVEYGDGYAAQTYYNEPHGRRLQFSWLGNPHSKTCNRRDAFDNEVFTGQMSVPMELDLVSAPTGLHLRRLPSKEMTAWRHATLLQIEGHAVTPDKPLAAKANDGVGLEVFLRLQAPSTADIQLQLIFLGQEMSLHVMSVSSDLKFPVGTAMPHEETVSARGVVHTAQNQALPIQVDGAGFVTIQALIDRHSVELFDVSGGSSMAVCTPFSFHTRHPDVVLRSVGQQVYIETFKVYELGSAKSMHHSEVQQPLTQDMF